MSQVNIKNTLDIVEKINEYIARKEKDLPYNINVIDELHANENAHSRILCKLLQYKDSSNKFRILEDLIQYISQLDGKEEFARIKITSPLIDQEQERIDLWVRDKDSTGYAIIFENKVKGAGDQPNQLARYIDKTRKVGFPEKNIFVVYLPHDDHEPEEYSWILDDKNYKKDFRTRYANLSFRTHILPWLKENILPNCIIKEELLISAVKQYIDHLEGLFLMRPSQKKMIMNNELLEKLEIKHLNIEQQIEYVDRLNRDISTVQKILNDFQEEKRREIAIKKISPFMPQLKKLAAETLKKNGLLCYINRKYIEDFTNCDKEIDWTKQYTKISFRKNEWDTFEIGFNFEGKNLTHLISGVRHIDSLNSKPDVHKHIVEIFTDHKHSGWWPAYQYIPKYKNWLALEMQEYIETGELIRWMENMVNYYYDRIENLNL